jgi:hypothetical protein
LHHISTDEVYSDLPHPDEYLTVGIKSGPAAGNVGWASAQQKALLLFAETNLMRLARPTQHQKQALII